jgi:uncharacterized protein (DUF849 family)
VPRKADNPAVPITVAEQVESTHEAFEAGASLVHIHLRNPDETPSSDPQLFKGVCDETAALLLRVRTPARESAKKVVTYQRNANVSPAARRLTDSARW